MNDHRFVADNAAIPTYELPGLSHQTLAGAEHGLRTVEVWMQTVAPGAGTPVHRHDCEEVILVLRGSGRLTVAGRALDFGPGSTLRLPPDVVHQLVNTGAEELWLVAALGQAPVQVCDADGGPIPLPWQGAALPPVASPSPPGAR